MIYYHQSGAKIFRLFIRMKLWNIEFDQLTPLSLDLQIVSSINCALTIKSMYD